MGNDSSDASLERMLNRRDPKSSLLRSYVLSLADCESLVTQGFDLETVGEEELSRRAMHFIEYDAHGRITRKVSKFLHESVITFRMDGN